MWQCQNINDSLNSRLFDPVYKLQISIMLIHSGEFSGLYLRFSLFLSMCHVSVEPGDEWFKMYHYVQVYRLCSGLGM